MFALGFSPCGEEARSARVCKQPDTLEKYDEAMNEMHSVAEVEAFSYGFRLGVKLMIEAGVPLSKERI